MAATTAAAAVDTAVATTAGTAAAEGAAATATVATLEEEEEEAAGEGTAGSAVAVRSPFLPVPLVSGSLPELTCTCALADEDEGSPNYRRRQDERGSYQSSPGGRRAEYPGGPGGGGYNGGGRGYYERQQAPPSLEAQKTRFKETLWKLGTSPVRRSLRRALPTSLSLTPSCCAQSYDPTVDLPSLAEDIQSWYFRDEQLVFLAFRAACVPLSPHTHS